MVMFVLSAIFFVLPWYALAGVNVVIWHARYCTDTGLFGCKSWVENTNLKSAWVNAGVPEGMREKTWLGVLPNGVSGTNVRRVALFSAGQAQSSGSDGNNGISGQPASWRPDQTVQSRTFALDDRSLADRIYDERGLGTKGWTTSNSAMFTVFDSQFDHLDSVDEKQSILNAFQNYLFSYIGSTWSNLDYVYVAGSSRGGCLAVRLAKQLMPLVPSTTKFIIQDLDGVCKESQTEFGLSGSTIDNPVNGGNYKAYAVDLTSQFPVGKDRICYRGIVGGDEVVTLSGIRAFTLDNAGGNKGITTLAAPSGYVWAQQNWEDLCHTCMGRDYANSARTFDVLVNHFKSCF